IPRGKTSFAPRNDMAVEMPGTGRVPKWSRRNMSGWEYWINAQHYWFYAIPPKAHFEEHPKWFSLLGGKRKPRQLCTSNPEVIARMTKVARDYLRRDTNPPTFPIDPNDILDFCQCDECVALDVPGALTGGVPSVTDRIVIFANAVADGIREEFPDRHVAFCAYATHIDPPERVKPRENVLVLVCRSSRCLIHLTPTANCPTSDFHELIRRWRELTPNVYTYEYDPIHWSGELPCPTYMDMGRSLQHQLRNLGVRGSFSDATMGGSTTSASWYINHYMARRMKVNPDWAPEDVLRDMCGAFFGPAADAMERYYGVMARATKLRHPSTRRIGGGINFLREVFSPRMVAQAREHLNKALVLVAGRELYEARVEMVDMSQRYLEAWLEGLGAAEEHRYEASVAAFDRMDQVVNELESHGYIAADDARFRARALRMKPLAQSFPDEMGFVTRWRMLGPFDNSDRNGHRHRDAFEPIGSLTAPVKLADGKQAQWWSHESPNGGLLNLERAFADKMGDWQLSYGYAATSYDAPRAMEAKLFMD
ncbi:MAG TPA: DUF4838 domain-containing protein, partial [Armatimonadota bacterium]|nr:DUF4838 domain-containing protein [Armatimonadota bacterium]